MTYSPLNTAKALGYDIWMFDGPVIRMSAGLVKIPFSTRMVVVRLADGALWVHSPITLNDELRAAVAALGTPRWLIAPNKIHYAYIQDWLEAFPQAESWGVAGIEDRARANGIAVTIHHRLGDDAPTEWAGVLDQALFHGSRFMDEVAFFHRASGTVILTDLIENFAPQKLGWTMRIAGWFTGILAPNGSTPRDYRATFAGRHDKALPARDRVLTWPARQVVMAHGEPILADAPARLRKALSWLG